MKYTDISNLTINAMSQALGSDYMVVDVNGALAPLDSYKLADVGTDVLDSGSTDLYVKSLLVQIGKMVIDAKKYTSELPSMFVDSFEWGGYVERIYFAPNDVIKDEMYNLVDGKDYSELEHRFYQPNSSAKIFEEGKSITVPVSIVKDVLKEAFQSIEQMNSFLSGIYTTVENTIVLASESYAHMLVSTAIATSCEKTDTAVHLLTEYNALLTTNSVDTLPSAEVAMKNEGFLKFALERIATIKSQMRRWTNAFNNGAIPTFTSESDCKLALLNEFTKAVKFRVKADTFHPDEVGIGAYDTVSAWQAFKETDKTNFNLQTDSSISISADPNNKLGIGTSAFSKDYVIGLLYDYRAIGITLNRQKVTSSYTASADFWTQFHHMLCNYILDSNYNMVAFIID